MNVEPNWGDFFFLTLALGLYILVSALLALRTLCFRSPRHFLSRPGTCELILF